MHQSLKKVILTASCASEIGDVEIIQSLWSGYGELRRVSLVGAQVPSVIVKDIQLPSEVENQPRGWNSDFAHQRKLKSYRVEMAWYEYYASKTTELCKVPVLIKAEYHEPTLVLILEDLGHKYPQLPTEIDLDAVKVCLRWLASFHAQFMGNGAERLWPEGTYWHLETRPEELSQMTDKPLQKMASQIDTRLSKAHFQTIVHGDAKLANFCFANDFAAVAGVDFQYVGRGCGMKDVAYFMSSCLTSKQCFEFEIELLETYFNELKRSLGDDAVSDAIEKEWRSLFSFAWADFQRFLNGWSPGHWKSTAYVDAQVQQVIQSLRSNES